MRINHFHFLSCIFTISLLCTQVKAQYIQNSKFKWSKQEPCFFKGEVSCFSGTKSPQKPVVLDLTKDEMGIRLNSLNNSGNIPEDINGVVKIELYFFSDRSICVSSVGLKNIKMTQDGIIDLVSLIENIRIYKLAIHENAIVNTHDWLYLYFTDGIINSFSFRLTRLKE